MTTYERLKARPLAAMRPDANGNPWIPVRVLSPPVGIQVLITTAMGDVRQVKYLSNAEEDIPRAVAWMPMPEAYAPPPARERWLAVMHDGSEVAFDNSADAHATIYRELIHMREVEP